MFSWYLGPFLAEGQQTSFAPTVFDLRGIAFAAWTLAAFAIGALVGMLTRRVVPAIAATVAAWAGWLLALSLLPFAATIWLVRRRRREGRPARQALLGDRSLRVE